MLVRVCSNTFQARCQQYVNQEPPDAQAGFWRGRGMRDQIANICWNLEKAREIQKNIYSCFIGNTKAFDCVDHKNWKILKEMGVPDMLLVSWENCMQVKKQQNWTWSNGAMEQWTGSKLGEEYIKAVYSHSAYLTYMQSISFEMPDW